MDFDLFRSTILALIQGLTEFLPISSSAHLILPSELFGWDDQGLGFDMALHLGTLSAVILYFWKDLWSVAVAMKTQVFRGEVSDNSRLGWNIVIATIPVLIAGFLIRDYAETELRNINVIIATTLFFGLMLGIADRFAPQTRALGQLTWKTSLLIGLAQMFAVIPGTSRSGVTMTAALFCGLKRETAARFSFLLSVPTIAAAGLLKLIDLLGTPDINWTELVYATVVAAFTAFVCIHYFLKIIANFSFMPFVVYRLSLGVFLLWFFVL
jgi:undecaprenyl-diphosphatase